MRVGGRSGEILGVRDCLIVGKKGEWSGRLCRMVLAERIQRFDMRVAEIDD